MRHKFRYLWVNTATTNREKKLALKVILPGIKSVEHKYKVKVNKGTHLPNLSQASKNTYILVGPLNLLNKQRLTYTYNKLKPLAYKAVVNISPLIPWQGSMVTTYKKGEFVRKVDNKLGTNHIFPDYKYSNFLTPSPLDIESNLVCETFHQKVKTRFATTKRSLTLLKKLQDKVKSDIMTLSQLVKTYKFYDRAPTDGAVFIKNKQDLILASAQRTDKTNLAESNLVALTKVNTKQNFVVQMGKKLHTSDVELAQLAKDLDKKFLIHLHTPNKQVSRALSLKEFATIREYPYGELAYSKHILREARLIFNCTHQNQWFILKNHGLVFSVNKISEIHQIVKDFPQLVTRT